MDAENPPTTEMDGASVPEDLGLLNIGDRHYKAYVGPPLEFDLVAAIQFRILTTFGLRAHHRLLDFGCGSLRAGRLFIPYLDPDCYYGIEPNAWLIEEALEEEVGADQFRIKRPTFSHVEDFRVDELGASFDFILAQSIFSHTGLELITPCLASMAGCLEPRGLIFATFQESGWPAGDSERGGWVYPGCVSLRPATIRRLARDAGLHSRRLRWYHPRQRWYVMATNPKALPGALVRSRLNDPVATISQPFMKRVAHKAKVQATKRMRPL